MIPPGTLKALFTFCLLGSLSLRAAEQRVYMWEPSQGLSLSLDNVSCGMARSWKGGDPRARISTAAGGVKFVAGIDVAALELEFSPPCPSAIKTWLSQFMLGSDGPHQLVATDVNVIQKTSAIEYSDAHLEWLRLQAMDASHKSCRVVLGVAAISARTSPAAAPSGQGNPAGHDQSASFKLSIPGISSMSHVGHVGEIMIRKSPGGRPSVDNFVVVLNGAFANDLIAWRDALFAGGGSSALKTLTLQYLKADMQPVDFSLDFKGLGIVRVTRLPDSGNVEVEFFCAEVEFSTPTRVDPVPPTTTPAPSTQPTPTQPTATPTTNTPSDPSAEVKTDGKEASATELKGEDKGLRDPKGFPRPEGLLRERYDQAVYPGSTRESAGYRSTLGMDKLLDRYTQALQQAGWKRSYFNESGTSPETRMILMEWGQGGMLADLRLYGAKEGSTVSLTLITKEKP